jgi:hypothetical protein
VTVRFDNKHSRFTSKTVHVSVAMVPGLPAADAAQASGATAAAAPSA